MKKLYLTIAGIFLLSFIAGAIAVGDILANPIAQEDIVQTPVTIDIKTDSDNVKEAFSGVIISSADSNGNFGVYKEGVINRPLKMDVTGKTKAQIETEKAELARKALEEIKPLFETEASTPVTYLTDEQIVSINKISKEELK